jgi:hypothetical protein
MTLRDLCADGLGEEPSKSHRLGLWLSVMSVMSVKMDHLHVGGDIKLLVDQPGRLLRCVAA